MQMFSFSFSRQSIMQQLFLFLFATKVVEAQSPNYSVECQQANAACEENTDCVHRLAVLQSTW